jgi:hypothetical protein
MVLIGESETDTTIKLADRAPGFGDTSAPRGVIMTTAKLVDGTPTSGGKDYTHKGEGNDAYENFIENLTIDVGTGNPGAIGVDYLANNIGAIRDVRVIAPAGSGAIGIAMQRKWPGPALLRRVEVQGFDVGIAIANTEYGMALDHVTLSGQRRIALANDANEVAAAHLTIDATGTAIANTAAGGLIVLADSRVRSASSGAELLINYGAVVAHGISVEGYPAPQTGRLNGVWLRPEFARDSGMFRIAEPGPPLLIERLVFDMSDLGDQLAVQVTARRDVTLRDVVTAGTSVNRGATGGRMFIEDICCWAAAFCGPGAHLCASARYRRRGHTHRHRRQPAQHPRPQDRGRLCGARQSE